MGADCLIPTVDLFDKQASTLTGGGNHEGCTEAGLNKSSLVIIVSFVPSRVARKEPLWPCCLSSLP